MTTPEWTSRNRALALAAITGAKLTLGPALLRSARNQPSAKHWVAAALGEMVLDKLGVLPPRYRLSTVIPRALAGAWVARESLKADNVEEDLALVAMGAATAAGVSLALPMLRLGLNKAGLPDILLGLIEDAIALKIGSSATDMSMDQIGEAAREAIENLRDQLSPAIKELRERAAVAG